MELGFFNLSCHLFFHFLRPAALLMSKLGLLVFPFVIMLIQDSPGSRALRGHRGLCSPGASRGQQPSVLMLASQSQQQAWHSVTAGWLDGEGLIDWMNDWTNIFLRTFGNLSGYRMVPIHQGSSVFYFPNFSLLIRIKFRRIIQPSPRPALFICPLSTSHSPHRRNTGFSLVSVRTGQVMI